MRKILLLSYAFPPENTPAAIRPGQLSRYLPEYGFQPIIIASGTEGLTDSDANEHRVPSEPIPLRLRLASDLMRRVTRVAAPYNDRWPWVPFAATAATKLITSEDIVAIYSTSPFLASHFAALWLKMKFGLPWVADFQDPIRDNPFRMRKWPYPYDAIIERSIFCHADWILANTDTVAATWRSRYPQWTNKISVSWNSFDPGENVTLAMRPQLPYRVLAHAGSLYGRRHPGKLLDSIERLGIGQSALRVQLLGPVDSEIMTSHGVQFERLHRKGLLELDNRLVPRVEAIRATAEADYLLLLDVNEHNTSFQLPSKLLDYVRVGKPILAYTAENSPVERILSRSGIPHVTIDPRTPADVSDKLLREFLKLEPAGYQPSPWFTANFSAKALANSTAEILDGLLQQDKYSPAEVAKVLTNDPSRFTRQILAKNGVVRNSKPHLVTTCDAEEEFDWTHPFSHDAKNVTAMTEQHVLHRIFDRYNIVPTYFVTYPVATSDSGSAFLTECLKQGRCQIGSQLHPWVTPPFEEIVNPFNSFAGNLPSSLEFAKLKALTEAIFLRFGIRPNTYRAGRYGIGPNTVPILKALGYQIDSSVVPQHSYRHEGGPTFFGHSNTPSWLDSENRLLELPLTCGYVGLLANRVSRMPRAATMLFGDTKHHSLTRSILARSGMLERIRLTPEGMTIAETKRLVRSLLKRGLNVFTLSYHAPSLVPGNTPYVRSVPDRERFIDWFDEFYQFFIEEVGGVPATPAEIYNLTLSVGLEAAR